MNPIPRLIVALVIAGIGLATFILFPSTRIWIGAFWLLFGVFNFCALTGVSTQDFQRFKIEGKFMFLLALIFFLIAGLFGYCISIPHSGENEKTPKAD